MIKFEHTDVMNFEAALRGMRNPLNSWDKSDSLFHETADIDPSDYPGDCLIGVNDMTLALKLINAGSDHRKFLRQIFVSVDITAPLYWWKEFDTYKVGTVANSCSTMHTIHKKEFYEEDFSFENISTYNTDDPSDDAFYGAYVETQHIISTLNRLRYRYLETKDKRYWDSMIKLLPTSYNQKRTVTLNYENLRNIYASRRNHKLNEWSVGFMDWVKTLPYADELIIG